MNTTSCKLSNLLSKSREGSIKKTIVKILLSPGFKFCSTKQKHSDFIIYGYSESGETLKSAVDVISVLDKFFPTYFIILVSPIFKSI